MSIAQYSLVEASIAQTANNGGSGKRAPSKRTAQAVADQKLAPEPR